MSMFFDQPFEREQPYPLRHPEATDAIEFVDQPLDRPKTTTQRRRASHNAVERRRRDTIAEKIRELSTLIPDDFVDYESGQFSASELQHKSVVLRRSVDYMRYLREQLYMAQQNEQTLLQRVHELEKAGVSTAQGPLDIHPVKQEYEHIEL